MAWGGAQRLALFIALAVVLVASTLLAVLWAAQRSLIYHPDESAPVPPPDAVEVQLTTADGLELSAWRVDPTGPDRNAAVLLAPGNAGNRADRMPTARGLAAEGFAVLLLDYRGYGGNPGSPAEDGLYADARSAWAYLTEEAGFDPARMLLYGESLGTGVVTKLAAEVPAAGIVLRSPFTGMVEVARSHMPLVPVGMLLKDRYPLTEHLREISEPILVAYTANDEVVPGEQSIEVARVAASLGIDVTAVTVEAYGHNDPEFASGPSFIGAVAAFAEELGLGPPNGG